MNAKVFSFAEAGCDSATERSARKSPAGTLMGDRVRALDWERLSRDLDSGGNAVIAGLLSAAECQDLAGLYGAGGHFRSRVIMGRHGFGRGEYQYFAYPLPGGGCGIENRALSLPGADRESLECDDGDRCQVSWGA